MCIQIIEKEIIAKNKYLDYIGPNISMEKLVYAMRSPNLSLLKIKFAYKGEIATMHLLTESNLLKESVEYINDYIKEIALCWAKENYYKIEPYDDEEIQKIVFH